MYLAKSLTDAQSETASTAGSGQSVQETASVSQQPEKPEVGITQVNLQATPVATVSTLKNNVDTYQTLINTLISQQWQMVGQATAAGTVQSQRVSTSQAQPSWKDPQIHITTTNGKSASSYYDM